VLPSPCHYRYGRQYLDVEEKHEIAGAYFPSSDALLLNRAAHEITSKANSILLEKK
jgi:hypothetical protein